MTERQKIAAAQYLNGLAVAVVATVGAAALAGQVPVLALPIAATISAGLHFAGLRVVRDP